MAEIFRDEQALREFQDYAAAFYVAGRVEEVLETDGMIVGTIGVDEFKMVDTYREGTISTDSPEPYIGRTVVYVDDTPVWAASYDTTITEKRALDSYYKYVMDFAEPMLPLFGINNLKDHRHGLLYRTESLLDDTLSIARFVVQETMTDIADETIVPYVGRTQGGWL